MRRYVAILATVILLLSSACAESATAALQELYAQAELLMVQGDYTGAAAKFEALGTYSDSSQMTMYCKAIDAAEILGLYSMAVNTFKDLGEFRDSKQMARYYEGRAYESAGTVDVVKASDTKLDEAILQLEEAEKVYGGLAFFKDSMNRLVACGEKIKAIKDEQLQREDAIYQKALAYEQNGEYYSAIKLYQSINKYKDSTKRISSCQTAILNGEYDAAIALLNAEKYSEAYDALIALNGHRDSKAKANAIRKKAEVEKFAKATVGSYVVFGTYEQDNVMANGKENIEWLVLAKENNRILVISRYALDYMPYTDHGISVTWETCTLRRWLNTVFLDEAFSITEQELIPTVRVAADMNPLYTTSPGVATRDKVFLLSIVEAEKYFKTDSARACMSTAYASVQHSLVKSGRGWPVDICIWWLRSPGDNKFSAATVSYGGDIEYRNKFNSRNAESDNAIRPALWINIEP